ncbi:MAG: hypothetical protein M3312_03000 [Actinomycetota bacterium]|nr:hypothetical protein [Actinomycetota bacterium]
MPSRGPRAKSGEAPSARIATPRWHVVEQLLATLAETRAFFPTATSRSNWISSYEPGKRLRLETDARWKWIQVEHLKACWDTFERLRRIQRADVLEPGRCSAFVMALFARVPGVREEATDEQPVLLLDWTGAPDER